MRTVIVLMAALVLNGCIIVTDRDDFDDHNTDWRQVEADNRDIISTLSLGSDVEQIREILGSPQYSESFDGKDGQYLVLRYRTQHRHSDGETSLDETTPLVFRDGRLIGWGETALSTVL